VLRFTYRRGYGSRLSRSSSIPDIPLVLASAG
jgi:hypothetical protein